MDIQHFLLPVFLILLLSVSLFFISASFYNIKIIKLKREKNKMDLFNISTTSSEAILMQSLDNLIADSLGEYAFIEIENNSAFVMNDNTEREITLGVANKVITDMSEVMYRSLCLIYRENRIPEIISNKVYAHVVAYLTNKRSELEE